MSRCFRAVSNNFLLYLNTICISTNDEQSLDTAKRLKARLLDNARSAGTELRLGLIGPTKNAFGYPKSVRMQFGKGIWKDFG
jgi:hypothetical protein